MLRVAASLSNGEVRTHDLIRMLARNGRPTGLGDAFAHYGRIYKTLHVLQLVHDDSYRRLISGQLSVQEARHRLARRIFFGQRGELRQHYREGMEDQLSALGLVLNATALWNTLYIDHTVNSWRPAGSTPATSCYEAQRAAVRPHQLPRPLHLCPATTERGAATAATRTRPTTRTAWRRDRASATAAVALRQRSSASSAARRSSSSERA